MVHISRIEELREEIGDEDMRAVLDIFRAEAEQVILTLGQVPDDDAYEKAIHFLRSGALNLGLQSLAMHAENIRRTPKEYREAAAQDLRRTLEIAFDQIGPLPFAAA
jgi:HPt (histidine-containing phosphotransfer) domain-containing protein